MKYLKSIFENLDIANSMVLKAYQNAIKNDNRSLFNDLKNQYGFGDDIYLELATYCIFELKNLNVFDNIFEFDLELELDHEEVLETLFSSNNYWSIQSTETSVGCLSIHKDENKNEFKLSFDDDELDNAEDEADFQLVSKAIHQKIHKELKNDLSTGMWINTLSLEEGVETLQLLFREEERKNPLIYVDGKYLKDIVKENIHKLR